MALPPQVPHAPTATMHLELRDADGSTVVIPLRDERLVIGRSSKSDLRLDHETVSRLHAELYRDPFGRLWIRDLHSRNGTKVNGELVTESLVSESDVVSVGDFALTLRSSREAPGTPQQATPVNDAPDTHVSVLQRDQVARIDTLHLSTLNEFAHRLVRIEDSGERMRTLCRLMIRNDFHGMGATVLRLFKDNPRHPPQVLCEPTAVPRPQPWQPYISRGLLSALRQNEAPVMASTSPSDPGALEMSIDSESQAQAAIACPLRSDARHLDVLYVTFPAPFGTAEWMALVALACQQYQQAEAAIQSARQAQAHAAIEKELQRAQEIQMRLLPTRLDIPGLDVAIGFEPCRWVGGDYADVVRLKDGRVMLVIADVCGKGLPAALVSSSLHTMIRTLMRSLGVVETIRSVNEHLCEYLDETSFVTLVAVVIDPASGAMEIVNAGHLPPLIVTPAGESRTLDLTTMLPLGITPLEIELQHAVLEPDELLFMFTDGLTELRDMAGKMMGTPRLTQEMRTIYRDLHGRPAEEISRSVRALLDSVQGESVPLDDRTFLLAKRVGY